MNRRGVSMLEVVVVSLVLTVLAVVLAPRVSKSAYNTRVNQTTFKLQTMRAAILKHQAKYGQPPQTLADLTKAEGDESPWLAELPVEGILGNPEVELVDGQSPIQLGGEIRVGGWIYNRSTGEVRVNIGAHRDL